jgi:hypothetical protein
MPRPRTPHGHVVRSAGLVLAVALVMTAAWWVQTDAGSAGPVLLDVSPGHGVHVGDLPGFALLGLGGAVATGAMWSLLRSARRPAGRPWVALELATLGLVLAVASLWWLRFQPPAWGPVVVAAGGRRLHAGDLPPVAMAAAAGPLVLWARWSARADRPG